MKSPTLLPLIAGVILLAAARARATSPDVTYVPGSSQKLEQFIGDKDFQTGLPTLSLTKTWSNLLLTNSQALPFTLNDTNAAILPRRFYRALLGP
jgi:hypothetical protein